MPGRRGGESGQSEGDIWQRRGIFRSLGETRVTICLNRPVWTARSLDRWRHAPCKDALRGDVRRTTPCASWGREREQQHHEGPIARG
jgi:hypothetical protein